MTATRRSLLAALADAAMLPLLAGCPGQPTGDTDVDVPDCDADDRREGDPDCEPGQTRRTRGAQPRRGGGTRTGGGRRTSSGESGTRGGGGRR